MKLRMVLSAVCLFGLSASPAFANHEGGLQGAAAELNEQVQCSSLRYGVKVAVNAFAQQAARFSYYCGGGAGMTEPLSQAGAEDLIQPMNHEGGGANCRYELQMVLRTFHSVSHYLSDAYDYPSVYNSFLETQSAVQSAASRFGRFDQ